MAPSPECLEKVLSSCPATNSFVKRDTRDAWGPSSIPTVVASLVSYFHVPQVRRQLLQGVCHLPLPVKLKVKGVCSSFLQQELSWPGMSVLLPPLVPGGPSTQVWPIQWQDVPKQPSVVGGHKLVSVWALQVQAQTGGKWGEWLGTDCSNKMLHKPKQRSFQKLRSTGPMTEAVLVSLSGKAWDKHRRNGSVSSRVA